MTRGIGGVEFAAGLPEPVAVAAALVTAFGDVWFVFALLGALYWFGPAMSGPVSLSRPRAAFAIALAFGGLAVTTTLKETFRLPRPPGAAEPVGAELIPEIILPLYAEIGASDGFGFPSGHAISAVVVYGGLAALVGTRRGYAIGGVMCLLLPASRVLLGVHYVVDVVAGLAVGGAYLAVVYRLCDRGDAPGRAMGVALAVALVGAAVAYTDDTMLALGGALGARMGWGVLGDAVGEAPATRRVGTATAAVGAVFGVLFVAVYSFEGAPYVGFVGAFVVVWGVLAAPLVGELLA